ncbi:hypothetical protein HGG64_01990 [Mycoplasma phocoeninasale]|uniref:Septation ring formation regulator n=1 Tax=Mycoplasma phocoeninasale TaxID=2726117 RepID=A0A858U6Q7_9MOLU|nr:hypothetical protein [Mycoplasma phocoeninasale]QJG66468.1 hypothetical protein HGG64_01990 [Mycoplasma phocoeninasale]
MGKLTILLSILLIIFLALYTFFIIYYLSRIYPHNLIERFNKYKNNIQEKLSKITKVNHQFYEFYSKNTNLKKLENDISKLISSYEVKAVEVKIMIVNMNNQIIFHLENHKFCELKCLSDFRSKQNEISLLYKQVDDIYQKIEKITSSSSDRIAKFMLFANKCLSSYKEIQSYKERHSKLWIFNEYFASLDNKLTRRIEKLLSWFNKDNFNKKVAYINSKKQEIKLLIDQYFTLITTAFNYIDIIENDINDKIEIAKNTLREHNPNFQEWQIVEFDNYKEQALQIIMTMKNEKVFSWKNVIKPKLLELCKIVNEKYNEVIFEKVASKKLDSIFPEIINFFNITKKQHLAIITRNKIDNMEYLKKMEQVKNKFQKLEQLKDTLYNKEKNLEYQNLLSEIILLLQMQDKIQLLEARKHYKAIEFVKKIKHIFKKINLRIMAAQFKISDDIQNLSSLISKEFEKSKSNDYNYSDVERLRLMIIVFVNNFNSNLEAYITVTKILRKLGEKASTNNEYAALYSDIEKLYNAGDYLKGIDTIRAFIDDQYN